MMGVDVDRCYKYCVLLMICSIYSDSICSL